MASKMALIAKILTELRLAQHQKWTPPPSGRVKEISLPPTLPLGEGRQLRATEALLEAISEYASIFLANEPTLRPRFKGDELGQIAKRVFAKALEKIDLDKTSEQLSEALKATVDSKLQEMVQSHRQSIQMILGCDLFDGDGGYPIHVGPVTFETREQWRQRTLQEKNISLVTARRLESSWSGSRKTLTKRKTSHDSLNEESLLNTIGQCQIVTTISTNGLSSKMLQEKGLLAARLAMTAISLMWAHPSQTVKWMKLHYDRRIFHRHYVLFNEKGHAGSSSSVSQMPSGRWTDAKLIADLDVYQTLFDQVGEALTGFTHPNGSITRPKTMDALFLSLWWFHEACREPSDQMATTKFAASMDTLSGGHKATGIIKLIGARLGPKPDDRIMLDGRTTKKVVTEFYDAGRSRLIHGSSDDYSHDWTKIRASAEAIGRNCLVACCDWLYQNPTVDDLRALNEP